MRQPRSKITDVARLAGVSVASVSRVLNDTDAVADSTRLKVLKAVEHLDFRIDLRARALSRQKSETLGIVVADVSNPFTAQVLKAIDFVTRESGYSLLLSDSGEDVGRERANLEAMLAQRIEGIIYLPVTLSGASLRRLIAQDIPVVCLDRYVEDVATDAVVVDNERAGALAADILIALASPVTRPWGAIGSQVSNGNSAGSALCSTRPSYGSAISRSKAAAIIPFRCARCANVRPPCSSKTIRWRSERYSRCENSDCGCRRM
jgi:DNA-binding LacI/PurR family transcriptional regulator